MKYLTNDQSTTVLTELNHALINTNAELAITGSDSYRSILITRHKAISVAISIVRMAPSNQTS